MAIQNNFPNLTPTLLLDFANTNRLDPRITFSRASTATYFNSLGVLTTANNNVARFDYNPSTLAAQGLLIEEQRTNLLTYSADFANAAWTKTRSSITSNTIVAPDGTLTGDKLVEDASASASHSIRSTGATISVGSNTSFSVFAKASERTAIVLRVNNAADSIWCAFNLSTGTVGTAANSGTGSGATGSIISVGNGWYRCTVSGVTSTTAASVQAIIYPAVSTTDPTNTSIIYTGDGTSGIFIWGAQLEAGAFATSYIPTTTTALTRNADVASMTGTNFSSWYNASEGTLFAQSQTAQAYAAGVPARVSIDDGTISNRIAMRNGNNFSSVVTVSGSPVASLELTAWNSNITKQAIAYKVDDFAYTTNGASVVTDTSGAIPSVNRLGIGLTGTQNFLNGTISRIAYYPVRVTNAQLQALTG
jgi:hypothetical protein